MTAGQSISDWTGNVLEHISQELEEIEADRSVSTRKHALQRLRTLGLDDFGVTLLSMPNPKYQKLSMLLPRMASEDAQRMWTGAAGGTLLLQTTAFVRSLVQTYRSLGGTPLTRSKILDYGCGYGRIARVMYYFCEEDCLFGCDPWDRSIETCHQDGLGSNFRLSEYLPETLPVDGHQFDLMYAFSVFTHLSKNAALVALSALRRYVKENGLLAITVRPIEYWKWVGAQRFGDSVIRDNIAEHHSSGFTFRSQDSDVKTTFGHASMSLDWLNENAIGWQVISWDRSLLDALQLYVFLRPTQ